LNFVEKNLIKTTTIEKGSSGSPLLVRKNIQKYYIIGIHYGK